MCGIANATKCCAASTIGPWWAAALNPVPPAVGRPREAGEAERSAPHVLNLGEECAGDLVTTASDPSQRVGSSEARSVQVPGGLRHVVRFEHCGGAVEGPAEVVRLVDGQLATWRSRVLSTIGSGCAGSDWLIASRESTPRCGCFGPDWR